MAGTSGGREVKLSFYTHGKGEQGYGYAVMNYEAPTIHAHYENKDVTCFVLHHASGIKNVTSNLPFILES